MSQGTCADVTQFDFIFCPDQPLTLEQRLEVLELEVAEMREQISALAEQVTWLTLSDRDDHC